MSRYLILIILTAPLIILGILNALVSYKLKRTSRRRFILRTTIWVGMLTGIVFAEPIYRYLFTNNLTQTEPLSLFDVIQITGIVFAFFIAGQALSRVDNLESRVQDLHRELSIRLSTEKDNTEG